MHDKKSIGHLITIINRYTQIYLMDQLKDLNLHGSGQIRIVLTLGKSDEGLSQEELASYLMVDKATISRMIKPMLSNGTIQRIQNPMDKRAYILKLADKTSKNLPEIRNRTARWSKIISNGLTENDLENLDRILRKLDSNACNYIRGDKNGAKTD